MRLGAGSHVSCGGILCILGRDPMCHGAGSYVCLRAGSYTVDEAALDACNGLHAGGMHASEMHAGGMHAAGFMRCN